MCRGGANPTSRRHCCLDTVCIRANKKPNQQCKRRRKSGGNEIKTKKSRCAKENEAKEKEGSRSDQQPARWLDDATPFDSVPITLPLASIYDYTPTHTPTTPRPLNLNRREHGRQVRHLPEERLGPRAVPGQEGQPRGQAHGAGERGDAAVVNVLGLSVFGTG